MVRSRGPVRKLESLRRCGSEKPKTRIVESIDHAWTIHTIGFASQVYEKNECIHKSFHRHPGKVSH